MISEGALMTALLFMAGGVLVVHGTRWLLRGPASRNERVSVVASAVILFLVGLAVNPDLLPRLGIGLLLAGLTLERGGYGFWQGPLTRWAARYVDRNPALRERLAKGGIHRDPKWGFHRDRQRGRDEPPRSG